MTCRLSLYSSFIVGNLQGHKWPISWINYLAYRTFSWWCFSQHGRSDIWCTHCHFWKSWRWTSFSTSAFATCTWYWLTHMAFRPYRWSYLCWCLYGMMIVIPVISILWKAHIRLLGSNEQLLVWWICNGDTMSHWQGKSLFFSPMIHAYAILL